LRDDEYIINLVEVALYSKEFL